MVPRGPEALDSGQSLPEEALARLLPELEALPPEELAPVNLDIQALVICVLSVHRHVTPYREAMEVLPIDLKAIDKLPLYAKALATPTRSIGPKPSHPLPWLSWRARPALYGNCCFPTPLPW